MEKIPESYKIKYYNILKPDENKDEFENYYDLNIKKTILENIEKLEFIDSKVKVLVLWSEKSDIFGTWDSLNQKDNPIWIYQMVLNTKLRLMNLKIFLKTKKYTM